jgi:hypothetical protein
MAPVQGQPAVSLGRDFAKNARVSLWIDYSMPGMPTLSSPGWRSGSNPTSLLCDLGKSTVKSAGRCQRVSTSEVSCSSLHLSCWPPALAVATAD